jgi:hypothetical protein
MDLSFYTVQPRHNKTFILSLIPRIVEGKAAKYITGSGQTKATSDRVTLYRLEGNCEKMKRPPRRSKEEMLKEKEDRTTSCSSSNNDPSPHYYYDHHRHPSSSSSSSSSSAAVMKTLNAMMMRRQPSYYYYHHPGSTNGSANPNPTSTTSSSGSGTGMFPPPAIPSPHLYNQHHNLPYYSPYVNTGNDECYDSNFIKCFFFLSFFLYLFSLF